MLKKQKDPWFDLRVEMPGRVTAEFLGFVPTFARCEGAFILTKDESGICHGVLNCMTIEELATYVVECAGYGNAILREIGKRLANPYKDKSPDFDPAGPTYLVESNRLIPYGETPKPIEYTPVKETCRGVFVLMRESDGEYSAFGHDLSAREFAWFLSLTHLEFGNELLEAVNAVIEADPKSEASARATHALNAPLEYQAMFT